MESLDMPPAGFMDRLLDFSDIGEEDDDDRHNNNNNNKTTQKPPRNATALVTSPLTCNGHAQALSSAPLKVLDPDNHTPCIPEFVEEELEWLSNKDAFPSVETFVGILAEHTGGSLAKHHSPVSVLDNSTTSSNSSGGTAGGVIMSYCGSFRVPGKARSKCLRRRPRDIKPQQCWWSQANLKSLKQAVRVATGTAMGRKCMHCGVEKTPQWRAGPMGPKTLCNACGVRFKSGRLVPEYRPANSPTFSSKLHSNFHRKVVDMRKQKMSMGLPIAKPLEKG